MDDSVAIAPLELADAAEVHALIVANRAHLDRWLRWSGPVRTLADVEAMIARFRTRLADGDGFHCGVRVGGALAGGVVCWYIHRDNRNAEVGYWLGAGYTGRGLATTAARWAVGRLFTAEGVHPVELQCAVDNLARWAVARRLGCREEGVRRESHWIPDRYLDHVIYRLLDREWSP